MDIMIGLIWYAGGFELQYGVKLTQACGKNIVDGIMSLKYPLLRSRSSYLRYLSLVRFLFGNGEVLTS